MHCCIHFCHYNVFVYWLMKIRLKHGFGQCFPIGSISYIWHNYENNLHRFLIKERHKIQVESKLTIPWQTTPPPKNDKKLATVYKSQKKTKNRATRTPPKTRVDIMPSGRVNIYCFTNNTRLVAHNNSFFNVD